MFTKQWLCPSWTHKLPAHLIAVLNTNMCSSLLSALITQYPSPWSYKKSKMNSSSDPSIPIKRMLYRIMWSSFFSTRHKPYRVNVTMVTRECPQLRTHAGNDTATVCDTAVLTTLGANHALKEFLESLSERQLLGSSASHTFELWQKAFTDGCTNWWCNICTQGTHLLQTAKLFNSSRMLAQ